MCVGWAIRYTLLISLFRQRGKAIEECTWDSLFVSTDSVVIIIAQGSAETVVSNVILAGKQDPSMPGAQLTSILHFEELSDSAKSFGYVRKRGKHRVCRGRNQTKDLCSYSLICSSITWVCNFVRAGTDILLTHWHQILLHVDLCSTNLCCICAFQYAIIV